MSYDLSLCDAHRDDYPSVHTCDDPVSCALGSLGADQDPRDDELDRLHVLLDKIEEAAGNSRAGVCKTFVAWIRTERGGRR